MDYFYFTRKILGISIIYPRSEYTQYRRKFNSISATIIPNLTTFLEYLKSADLVGISIISKNLGLRLDFTYSAEVGDVAIELYQIIHLVLSQPLNYEDTGYCFWVGEVKLQQLSEIVPQVLSSLSYPFTNSEHLTTPLIQFYL